MIFLKLIRGLFLPATVLLLLAGCSGFALPDRQGSIYIRFSDEDYRQTKASVELPDTCDFLLTVKDSKGKVLYDGRFGDSPEELLVDKGTYYITVRSCAFDKPAFSKPQFGDEQCVVVASGGTVSVTMKCVQINSGIRLRIAPDFLTNCPDAALFVQSEDGRLMYSYSEKRIAYFKPGDVSVLMSKGSNQSLLFTRHLQARDILSVGISAAAVSSSENNYDGIFVDVDTTRNWINDEYQIGGGGNGGSDAESALNVHSARDAAGTDDVWVYGYVVGVFKSVGTVQSEKPFTTATNLIISGRTTFTSKDNCLSVELKKGDLRDELNLVDNPDLLGTKIYLQGDIVEAYYGIPGIKNITSWEFD